MFATASTVRHWLLIEQPGAWGADALMQSGIPERVGSGLADLARTSGARPLLIRRPFGGEATDRSAFLVATLPGDRRVERVRFSDPEELLTLDLDEFTSGARSVGEPVGDELVLVCTNGSHDSCCAVEGRPVVAAAAAVAGDAVWECSHVGGDRFAANLVCLPTGIYYGRVGADEVPDVLARLRDGRLSLAHYRGRAPFPFPVQAAERLARERLDIDRIDAVEIAAYPARVEDRAEVVLVADGRRWTATIAVGRDPEGHRLTCKATRSTHAPTYALAGLEPAPS